MLDESTPSAIKAVGEPSDAPPPIAWAPATAAGGQAHLVPGAEGLEYAGVFPRAAAWWLDGLVFFLLALVPLIVLAIVAPKAGFALLTLGSMALQAAYFSVGWRSGRRGTPGMRVLKLQIGRAADGQTMSVTQALTRWFVLTGWISLLSLIPALGSAYGLIALVWIIVLVVSVVRGARRQGIHDRISDTAIVRPVGASNTAVWVVVGIFAILPIIAIVAIIALIFLGSQVSGLLSTVGA